MPPKTATIQTKKKVKTETSEPVKESVKRELYKSREPKEFNATITELAKVATQMKDNLYKQINEEHLTNSTKVPDRADFDSIIERVKSLKDPYKELTARKKREASPSNYGLKTPQYMNGDMCQFVNKHAGFDREMLVDIDSKTDKGVFDRITLTKFWVEYIRKNELKDKDNKSLIVPDAAMNQLFGAKLPSGLTYFQSLEKRVTEIKSENGYKSTNNSARFNKDSTGKVVGFNFAALQIILAPVFQVYYRIPNQEKYIEKLTKQNTFLTSKKEPKEPKEKKVKA